MPRRNTRENARYDCYTRWIEDPKPESPESADQIERGSRVSHWEGMENGSDPLRAWDAIRWNTADAQQRAQQDGGQS